jgi:hypothetical protein
MHSAPIRAERAADALGGSRVTSVGIDDRTGGRSAGAAAPSSAESEDDPGGGTPGAAGFCSTSEGSPGFRRVVSSSGTAGSSVLGSALTSVASSNRFASGYDVGAVAVGSPSTPGVALTTVVSSNNAAASGTPLT